MAWLVRDGDVLAAVEVVDSFSARVRGVAAVRDLDGALLLRRPFVLHTFAAGPEVDVAFCDRTLRVASTSSLARHRIALPRPRAASVVVARAGAFERWGLAVGDHLEVKGV
ncbi:MAG TPA: DUF192 domain-containing protein [Acidimicrobiales bacterium]|nr:DUF192 domain-containing protein [Acidimicrobiales bacterium]